MSPGGSLTCGDFLHTKRITAWPTDFDFLFAVGANCNALNFFSQPGGPDYTHPALAFSAAKDFLQLHSSLTWSVQSPLQTLA